MSTPTAASRWRRRPVAAALALLLIAATLAVASAARPVPLAEVLLVVLVEVLAVSLVAGRTLAALTAVGAFVAVNWLLVPPYGTLVIADQQNWITLAVFLLLAVGVSSLVESVLAAERRAASAAAREAALAEALTPEQASDTGALDVLRTSLHLDAAALEALSTGEHLLSGADQRPGDPPTLAVDVAPGFRVLGWGPEVLGGRPEYVTTLATAAVRAWESERLVAEREHSARLAELDAARAALLASIGHDLRTPLAGIRVSADALAIGRGLSEEDRDVLLASLRQSAVRLDALLDAVLDAARIEAGAVRVRARTIDLREVLHAALTDFASSRVTVHVPDTPVPATVDPVICQRIVANLAGNALAHTPPESPVDVSCRESAPGAAITIVDHGPGLDEDVIDTGRNAHGMGLVIVDQLARFAGITVERAPTPGGGLTVTLLLGGPP